MSVKTVTIEASEFTKIQKSPDYELKMLDKYYQTLEGIEIRCVFKIVNGKGFTPTIDVQKEQNGTWSSVEEVPPGADEMFFGTKVINKCRSK